MANAGEQNGTGTDPVLPSDDQTVVVQTDSPTGEQQPLVIRMPVDIRNLALTVIASLGAVFMLQYAQTVLIPIVIGVLIAYALSPLVSGLGRVRLPRAIGAAVAVMLVVSALGVSAYTLSDEVMSIVRDVPQAAQRVRQRISQHRRQRGGALEEVQRAATEIDKAAAEAATPAGGAARPTGVRPDGVQKVEVVEPSFSATDYLWAGGVGLVNMAGQFTMILFLVYFLLVTGDLYKRKLVKIAGPRLSQKRITVQILDAINLQIESFIRVQILTSFIVAVATAVALWWLGVDEYIVWGLLAGVFNSIPYLGPILVTGGLGIVAFMQFDDITRTAYVCLVTLAITSLEGFLLTPALVGRAAQMNPVAIFVGLLFWSWIWGVWGTVLAVPMLMMLKAVCDHIEDLQPIGELLGESVHRDSRMSPHRESRRNGGREGGSGWRRRRGEPRRQPRVSSQGGTEERRQGGWVRMASAAGRTTATADCLLTGRHGGTEAGRVDPDGVGGGANHGDSRLSPHREARRNGGREGGSGGRRRRGEPRRQPRVSSQE